MSASPAIDNSNSYIYLYQCHRAKMIKQKCSPLSYFRFVEILNSLGF
jgi:hypothetical protein